MKKITLLKSMLLLCALVVGSSSVWAADTYVKVTSADDLVPGYLYILAETSSATEYVANTSYGSNKYGTITSGFTVNGNTITVTADNVLELRLGGTSGSYTLYDITYKGWLGKGSSNTNFARSQDVSVPTTDNAYYWDIKLTNGEYVAYSKYKNKEKDHTDRYIGRNTSSTGPYSNTSTFPVFVFYKKVEPITPAKTYTTLTSANALDFTNVTNLKAYIATEVEGDKVNMTQVNKVPSGTGLVLKATTTGSAINVPVYSGTTDDVSGNQMVGSATSTTAVAANAGYILSDGVFQPAKAGTLAAGKAYLAIAIAAPAHPLEMNFEEGDVTSISEIEKMRDGENETFFNLAGQRVAQPTKGLYIVNGKKVVLK